MGKAVGNCLSPLRWGWAAGVAGTIRLRAWTVGEPEATLRALDALHIWIPTGLEAQLTTGITPARWG